MSPVQSIPPPTVSIATPLSSNLNTTTKYLTPLTRTRKTMSNALSIPNITQKQMAYEPMASNRGVLGPNTGAECVSVEQSAVAAVAAAYQYNYNHMYADRAAAAAAAMYAAPPIMFTAPTHPALNVAAPIPAHANYKYNGATDSNTVFSSAYFNAIQNAVKAGIFSPTQVTSEIPPPTPAIPAPTLTPPTPTLPKSPSLHIPAAASPPMAAHNTIIQSGGTYLNEKAFNAKSTNAEVNYFKVPSGKEGSMKHRILTRPQNNAQPTVLTNCQQSTNNEETYQNAVMRTYDTTSNFRKGSYIELANGVLRKVEDMRTEDFIQCAERSPYHKLAESTVVKINLTPANTVLITFSYDNNRSRAGVEVSHDHPFFVYGQGWASYNPESSAKVFDLRCQRLQVGDICISLTRREDVPMQDESVASTASTAPLNMTVSAVPSPVHTNDNNRRYAMPTEYTSNVLPLSPHTPPAPSLVVPTSNHLSLPSTLAAHYVAATHNIPFHLLPTHLTALGAATHPYSAEMADLVSAYAYHAHLNPPNTNAPPPSANKMLSGYYQTPPPTHIYHGENQAKKTKIKYKHPYHGRYDTLPHLPAAPPQLDNHYHHHHLLHSHVEHQEQLQHSEDEPFDATIARKRRWSAPDGVSDEEEHHRQLGVAAHNGENGMYKIYKPAPVVATVSSILGTTQI